MEAPEIEASICGLYIYPMKSCGGIKLTEMLVDEMGPLWDRRWMLVDETGKFLSQRQFPKMAQIRTQLDQKTLFIQVPQISKPFEASLKEEDDAATKRLVQVWSDPVEARDEPADISEALSDFLKTRCFLVRMARSNPRIRNKSHRFVMSFADSRPLLLTNTSSLESLNQQMVTAVPMSRFRPNIVITNATPFVEDEKEIHSVGNMKILENIECERCSITTIDQLNGEKMGPEPLRSLAKTRKPSKGVVFGRRLLHAGPGKLKIGDKVSFS